MPAQSEQTSIQPHECSPARYRIKQSDGTDTLAVRTTTRAPSTTHRLVPASPLKRPPDARQSDCCCRTIWAARPLWSESGGRGGVSDLGGGEQPTAEASAASTSGSPSARTRSVAFALAGPAMPDGTTAIEGHPRPHARACVRRPSVRLGDVPRSGWVARRWPVLRNRRGRPAVRGSRPPRAMIARGRAGAPRRMRAIAQARRASRQARP